MSDDRTEAQKFADNVVKNIKPGETYSSFSAAHAAANDPGPQQITADVAAIDKAYDR